MNVIYDDQEVNTVLFALNHIFKDKMNQNSRKLYNLLKFLNSRASIKHVW
jgi:hypothetical protein